MDSKLQAAFDKWEASFDALHRYLLATATTQAQEAPAVAKDALPVCIEMVPVTCSMACPTQVVTNTNVDPKAGVQELDALSANTTTVTSEVDHGVVHIVFSDLTAPTLTKCSARCSRRDTNLPRYVFHPAATPSWPRPIPWPSWLRTASVPATAPTTPTASNRCSTYCATAVPFPAAPPEASIILRAQSAAIPVPIVKSLLGPYLVFLSSNVNEYEGAGYCWMTWDPGLMSHCILISCCPDRIEGHTMTCATRRHSLNSEDSGGACLLWMASDTVGERCNSEGSSENPSNVPIVLYFDGPGYFVTEGHVHVTTKCSTWQLFLSGSSAIFTLAKFLEWTGEPYGILLYVSQLARAKSFATFREFEHRWKYKLQAVLPWKLDFVMGWDTIVLACFQNGHKNLHLLLTHACQFTPELTDGSCCCVLISLNLHITISLADNASLGWGAHQAVFGKIGSELPLRLGWTCYTAIHQSSYEALRNKQAWELPMDICLMEQARKENIFYVVGVKEYYEPKLRGDHQRKELTGNDSLTWSDLGVIHQLSCYALNPWSTLELMSNKYWLLQELYMQQFRWFIIVAGHAWLFHGFLLMSLLAEQLLSTLLLPAAYCSITSNMFTRDAELPSLVIREVWLLDHQDMMQMQVEWPCLNLQDAHSESFVFNVAFGDGQGTFQGGRHVPVLNQHKELRLPWDPGGAAAACGQGTFDAIAVTTFFEQVFGGHQYYLDLDEVRASASYDLGTFFEWAPFDNDYYFYLIEVNTYSGYCRDFDRIKDRRLQWDPGKFLAMSAWGQAEFQGGRDVRTLSHRPPHWADMGSQWWAWPINSQPATD